VIRSFGTPVFAQLFRENKPFFVTLKYNSSILQKAVFLPIFRGKAFESIQKKIGYVLNGNCRGYY
jgi:hypothetical protein